MANKKLAHVQLRTLDGRVFDLFLIDNKPVLEQEYQREIGYWFWRSTSLWEFCKQDPRRPLKGQGMNGVQLIGSERERQLATGRTPEIDDTHVEGELLQCAIEIADDVSVGFDDDQNLMPPLSPWPYTRARHVLQKYGDNHIARLAIAGALIAAEIDRLLRKQAVNTN